MYIFTPSGLEGGATPPLIGRGGVRAIVEGDIFNNQIADEMLIKHDGRRSYSAISC
jgi:hypothetical protein